MNKGFTLLELIVVIIIIGILATLGFAQYARMIERSRGAEARAVLGSIRSQAAGLWIEKNAGSPPTVPAATFNNQALGIGNLAGLIADTCAAGAPSTGYYFSYTITTPSTTGFVATATRCTGTTGKSPGGPSATTLTLTTNFQTGTDSWGGTGGY